MKFNNELNELIDWKKAKMIELNGLVTISKMIYCNILTKIIQIIEFDRTLLVRNQLYWKG